MESLLGIVVEEGNRYHRMSSFMMKVLKRVTGNDHYLVYKVSSSIRRTHWSLYDLGDLVVDRHCNIDKEHVSGVIQDYRSKVINELKELHDNLSTDSSNTTTKQMIKDYIVAFEGGVDNELPVDDDLAKKLHKSEDLQMMILLNYAPIKKKSSTIISKSMFCDPLFYMMMVWGLWRLTGIQITANKVFRMILIVMYLQSFVLLIEWLAAIASPRSCCLHFEFESAKVEITLPWYCFVTEY
ncbi:hypothetical protein CTI12_AA418830 [Artemisia annua]|uniref:Uncharacterized protein n=1 Tax=Artemisia annua TaxID=35608 RepID=A0A2U1LXT0_ARTAN|nr:hypothetical protein CTI12_AA418830 [Artemisia annua]